MSCATPDTEFVLTGLDGSNPLGFLAALGTLRSIHERLPGRAQLQWNEDDLRPVLVLSESMDRTKLCAELAGFVQEVARDVLGVARYDSEVIAVEPQHFRKFALAEGLSSEHGRLAALFAAAFGSDAVVKRAKDDSRIEPTRLSLANGNGHKNLLKDFRAMALALPAAAKRGKQAPQGLADLPVLMDEALFEGRRRTDKGLYSFRWDPLEFRTAAHMAEDPSKLDLPTIPGANLLAVIGLTMLPSVPTKSGLATTAMFSRGRNECFGWPLWSCPLPLDVVFSLLTVGKGSIDDPPREWSAARGVFARFAVQRLSPDKKNLFFTQSFGF